MEQKTTKENVKNVYQKLALARVKLQEAKCKKTGKNAYAGFEYYQLEDFIPKLNVIFNELGLLGVFNMSAVEDIDHGVASLTIYNVDDWNDNIIFSTPTANANLKGCTAIQSLGGVHTYLKRYLYLNALEITEGDILDTQTGSKEFKPEEPKSMTPYQKRILTTQMEEKYKAYACQKYHVNSVEELTYAQAKYIIDSLTKKGLLVDKQVSENDE